MIYYPWASTSTDYIPQNRYKEMMECMDSLIDAYEGKEPKIRSYLKYISEHSKYKKYDIYVEVQYLERKIGFDVLDKQITKICIKVYKKDKLMAARTVDCLKNKIIPWIGGKECEWLAK